MSKSKDIKNIGLNAHMFLWYSLIVDMPLWQTKSFLYPEINLKFIICPSVHLPFVTLTVNTDVQNWTSNLTIVGSKNIWHHLIGVDLFNFVTSTFIVRI